MTVRVRQLFRIAGGFTPTPPIPPPTPTMQFVQQPTDTETGELFEPTISVIISDGGSDSLTISSYSGTCSLTPLTVVANMGIALFVELRAGSVGEDCRLRVHNNMRPEIADIISDAFDVFPAPPIGLLRDLISYWKLDEPANATAIDSHGPNNLSVVGNIGQAPGVIQTARSNPEESFSTNYLTIPSNLSLETAESFTFTFWLWVNVTTFFDVITVLGKDGLERGYGCYLSPDETINFFVATELGFTIASAPYPDPFLNWKFLVLWWDADNLTTNIQVNDGAVSTTSGQLRIMTVNPFNLFNQGYPDLRDLTGRLDEVGYWSRILEADERSQLYNNGNGWPYENFN